MSKERNHQEQAACHLVYLAFLAYSSTLKMEAACFCVVLFRTVRRYNLVTTVSSSDRTLYFVERLTDVCVLYIIYGFVLYWALAGLNEI
jgi:hypothetical protein